MTKIIHLGANNYGDDDAQLYETPREAVHALIAADPWLRSGSRLILEPACGPGAITASLQSAGHVVISSDLNQYELRWKGKPGKGLQAPTWNVNFFDYSPSVLSETIGSREFAVVTNPPYGGERDLGSKAARFVAHALELAPRVYMLLELGFQQGGNRCEYRDQLMDGPNFTGYFPFRERLRMHRDEYEGPTNNQTRLHAWYRWEREPSGPFVHRRLTCDPPGPCKLRRVG